jgi:Rrf2 family cysteine metabolism transcriptional repressor
MKLSKKGEYALLAVTYLSCRYVNNSPDDVVQIFEIAKHENIPEKFLQSILLQLKKSGVLRSHRGALGGYTLNRPPEKITMGEVIRVIDGPLAPLGCVSKSAHVACSASSNCKIQSVMAEVRDAISGVLDNITFKSLCKKVYGRTLKERIPASVAG